MSSTEESQKNVISAINRRKQKAKNIQMLSTAESKNLASNAIYRRDKMLTLNALYRGKQKDNIKCCKMQSTEESKNLTSMLSTERNKKVNIKCYLQKKAKS